ncbi:hypothetical protein Dimus_025411 [Dionaea muscipula]
MDPNSTAEGETSCLLFHENKGNDDEGIFVYADLIVNSAGFLMALKAAIDLDLLEIIAKAGPERQLSARDIAAELPTLNPEAPAMVDRMLRLLATFSVLKCTVVIGSDGGSHRIYGLAPVAKYLVRDEDGVSLVPYMDLLQHKVILDSWGKLKDAVLEGGIPFNKAYGVEEGAFEYTKSDAEYGRLLNDGMLNHTTIVMKKILQRFKGFEDIKQLVDVGSGVGHTLNIIVSKYPNVKGINFDLPHVISHAIPCPGVEDIGRDMFESVPSGDAILLKWILHCWSDDHCIKILKNCYEALPDDRKVIIVEGIICEEPRQVILQNASVSWMFSC